MPRFAAALAAAVVLVTLTASAGARDPARFVEYAVSLSGTQTTTWTSHGAVRWCSAATQLLGYDGSGQQVVDFRFPKAVAAPLQPGRPPSVQARATITVKRTGSVVAHDAAVTSRPAGCPSLPTTDTPAQSAPCRSRSATVDVLVSTSLRSAHSVSPTADCSWLGELLPDQTLDIPSGALSHPEALDGLIPLALPHFDAPGEPRFSPSKTRSSTSQSWSVTVPGGSLSVKTTIAAQASVVLVPLIGPGRSIADNRIGETYAELTRRSRPYGGWSASDLGTATNIDHRFTWYIQVHVPVVYQNDYLVEDAVVSAPAGGARTTTKPPPPTARVSQLSTVSTVEVTQSGSGSQTTLAQLHRAEPRGHLVKNGAFPIAWVVDGPGKRRTAFMLFRNVVQNVIVGCRQTDPHQPGAPVSDDLVC